MKIAISENLLDFINTGASRSARVFANFLLIGIVARLNNDSVLAEYFIYASISIPLSALASMGIGISAIKQIAGRKSLRECEFGDIHAAFYRSSIMVTLSATAVFLLMSKRQLDLNLISAVSIGITSALLTLHGDILRGLGHFRTAPLISSTAPSVISVLLLGIAALLRPNMGTHEVLFTQLLANLLLLWASTSKLLSLRSSTFPPHNGKIELGLKPFSVSLFSTIAPAIVVFLVARNGSTVDISAVGIAQRFNFLLVLPLWIISTTLPSRVAHLANQSSPKAFIDECSKQVRVIIYSTLFIAFGMTVVAPTLVVILTGNDNTKAVLLIRWLSFFSLIYAANGIAIALLGLGKLERPIFLLTPISTTLLIGIFFICRNHFDLGVSAVLAYQVSLIFHALVCHALIRMQYGSWLFPKRQMWSAK